MTKKTAAKVADVLGLAEAYLDGGRPRKLPGKPRPEAMHIAGLPTKITKTNFWNIEKVSLVGAIKMAVMEQGYSRTVRTYAEDAIGEPWPYTYAKYGLQGVDDLLWDTRRLRREIRSARKQIERTYLS